MSFPVIFNQGAIDQAIRQYLYHCNCDDFDDFVAYEGECTEDSPIPEVAQRIEQYFGAFMRYYRTGDYEDERGGMHDEAVPPPTPEEHDAIMVPAMNALAALQAPPQTSAQHTEEG